ncbi:MAG: hypothetical protein JSW06_08615 [Thermoplasmatales archaeon]|nr:MAG: hypothetical protein JSW06_08615 [Thermoplasmatales archaeon]
MNKKIIGIAVCMTLLMPMLLMTAVANESPTTSIIRGEHHVNSGETERVTCYFYGLDGSVITCIKEITEFDAEKLSNQLQAGSKAFVTLYSSDASDEEIIEAEEIIDTTLTMMDDLGVLPEGISVEEAKQLLHNPKNQAKNSTILGVIGSAGVGLLRPFRPVIAFPKVIVFWAYLLGATFSVGLNGFNSKLGPQLGFALFFVGFIASIGITGAFFGFTPFTFYL